jgi:predicted permease
MSVDSERMLKLENEVKELKTYINQQIGIVKRELNSSIDVRADIKSFVTKDYITDLYRNK